MIFCFKHSAGGYIQTTTQVVFLLVLSKSPVHVTIGAQFNECTFLWKPQRIGIFCSDFEYLPSNALDKITRSAENASCRAKKNQITCIAPLKNVNMARTRSWLFWYFYALYFAIWFQFASNPIPHTAPTKPDKNLCEWNANTHHDLNHYTFKVRLSL